VYPIYEQLAAGGTGTIISGHMYVHPDWKCSPAQTGIFDEMHLEGLKRLATLCKGNGARGVAQINYAARKPAEMTPDEIADTVDRFAAAAKLAVSAGFDGVQIHAAHGYLVSCFLTPSENTRDDTYGSDAEGRRRLLLEITERIRGEVGSGYPLLCKLGAVDGRDNSLSIGETVDTAKALEASGIDAIEVSSTFGGDYVQPAVAGISPGKDEGYFAEAARAVKQAVSIPVILVGGLRSMDRMQQVVDDNVCDLVSLCRPLIAEPDLVNKLQSGSKTEAACVSCNKCFKSRGLTCAVVTSPEKLE
jgi:2,4-dienoyl-CoA reductase-like NADH-dependent reductase (Old Yellow Enzyme family)